MCIVFVCMRCVKKFGCHYNQSGVLKIETLILLRLARFQNLGTPPKGPSTKDVRQMRRGGFEISDIPGGGWFVKVRTSENF